MKKITNTQKHDFKRACKHAGGSHEFLYRYELNSIMKLSLLILFSIISKDTWEGRK